MFDMARLTITLPDDLHTQLRLRAAHSGETIGQLLTRAVEDQKELARVRMREIMEAARAHAATVEPHLTEDEVMELAIRETHAVREEMARERRRGA
jgi:plasmid stability protein